MYWLRLFGLLTAGLKSLGTFKYGFNLYLKIKMNHIAKISCKSV